MVKGLKKLEDSYFVSKYNINIFVGFKVKCAKYLKIIGLHKLTEAIFIQLEFVI